MDLAPDPGERRLVGRRVEDASDERRHLAHLGDPHSTGGEGRGPDADAGGDEGLLRVPGDHVLVHGDAGLAEGLLGNLAVELLGAQVHEHQVVVGATGDEPQPRGHEPPGERPGVVEDLLLVGLEAGLERLVEGHGLGRHHVLEGAALGAREDLAVDRLGVRLAAEDQAAARAAQGLVGGGGDDLGVRHRVGVKPRGDEPGDVGHVHHHGRPDLAGNLGELVEVEEARVGAGAHHQDARPVLAGQPPDLVHVHRLVGLAQAVRDDLEEAAGEVHRRAVGEVAAEVEAHGEQRVARLGQGEVGRHVGLRPGVRLDVGVVGAEEPLRPVDGELLDLVHHLAATVVALPRVALGVLVGQGRAGGLQHRGGDEVLAGDELEPVGLAPGLLADEPGDIGVGLGEALGGHHVERSS